jgi:hypothetical protein
MAQWTNTRPISVTVRFVAGFDAKVNTTGNALVATEFTAGVDAAGNWFVYMSTTHADTLGWLGMVTAA